MLVILGCKIWCNSSIPPRNLHKTAYLNQKYSKDLIFSVFSFGCLGRNLYLCNDFVTC